MSLRQWSAWPTGVAATLASTAVLTAVLTPFESDLALLNEGLLFLLLTLGIATLWGVRVGVFAAVVTNVTLNFFFVPPLHRFLVHDPENVLALVAFLVVSVIAGSLVSAGRSAAAEARLMQSESEALLRLTRALIGQTEPQAALAVLCEHVVDTFGARGAAVLSSADRQWSLLAAAGNDRAGRLPDVEERSVADRVLATGRMEGFGYSGLSGGRRPRIVPPQGRSNPARTASVTFIALRIGDRSLGVLRLDGPLGDPRFGRQTERLLPAFAREAALAMQRSELTQAAAHAEAWRQADRMKSALMASVSHDLKTPLATIKASVSSLLDASVAWSEQDKLAFLETIESQTDRLDRVISDILDLSRIQAGAIASDIRPTFVLDVVDDAREAAARLTEGRTVLVSSGAPEVVLIDRTLVRQALVNLIANAAKYSPPGTPIHIEANATDDSVGVVVADEGPGIAAADLPYIFDIFYRGTGAGGTASGSGLGLAIAKAFVELSGGAIGVESSSAGTRFILTLPRACQPQSIAG